MDKPAGFGSARLGLCTESKKNGRHTFLRGSERKAPAGRQIERFQRARNFNDESAYASTGQNIGCGAQGIFAIRHAQQY